MKKNKKNTGLNSKNKLNKNNIKPFDYLENFSRFTIKFWKEFYKRTSQKEKLFLIIMQLTNGKIKQFTITASNLEFNYLNKTYIIDPDLSREDVTTGLNVLYYHQEVAIPFKINFNLDLLRKNLKDYDNSVEKAINPSSLKDFINSKVIEKVLKGQELTDEVLMLKKLVFGVLIITAVTLLVILQSSGIINI